MDTLTIRPQSPTQLSPILTELGAATSKPTYPIGTIVCQAVLISQAGYRQLMTKGINYCEQQYMLVYIKSGGDGFDSQPGPGVFLGLVSLSLGNNFTYTSIYYCSQ